MTARLKEIYKKDIIKDLKNKFGYKNINMSPKLEKIVINMGLGLDGNDSKIIKSCENDLSLLSGQKPVLTKFKKSISNFKTRKGTSAGLKVSLRKDKMYEFLDRLVNIALPRIKDFRGLSFKGFDKYDHCTRSRIIDLFSTNKTHSAEHFVRLSFKFSKLDLHLISK